MAQRKRIELAVNVPFRDKHTKEIHEVGDILKVTEKRYQEIVAVDSGLVSIIDGEEIQDRQKD